MLEAMQLARGYVAEMTKSAFLRNRRTQQAVVLKLIALGEIATRSIPGLSVRLSHDSPDRQGFGKAS